MSPLVRLEPIGEEFECEADETILDAAFRHGYSLVHGCREGQCSACKAYLVEGEVFLQRYSTFALSESEESQGYTLLCRAMPEEDLTVELLHYDPEHYRLEVPIRDGRGRVRTLERLTHDIYRLELEIGDPDDFSFVPGQYVDLRVPGDEGRHRSFSMANLPGEPRIELIIRRYPGGRFSSLLEGGLAIGEELEFRGPYGAFALRNSSRDVLMIAGGTGMAPVLSLLRQMAEQRSPRRVRFFYGARTARDLFGEELIARIGCSLGDFRFVPVLSDPGAVSAAPWAGELGFVHEAAERYLNTGELRDFEVYMCGPPAMIDAALEMLTERHGHDPELIFWDKFTTSADAEVQSAEARR